MPRIKHIKSPFGYFGSKLRIAMKIVQHIPPHNAWVDAFCGSASITLKKSPAPIEIINDMNGEVVNFFQQLRDHSEELCRKIELTPYAREELSNARSNEKPLSELERARRFLVSSMMAINGVFGEERGGFSYSQSYARSGREARVSRWCNLPDRLMLVVDRLKDIRIENKDARALFKMFLDRPATLVYLDPPYLGKRTQGYDHDANTKAFHSELLQLACKAKCMVLMSSYDNSLYRDMLCAKDGWKPIRIATHTRGSNGKSSIRTEFLWKNKYCLIAEEKGKVPVTLTEKELKQGKLNPRR